MMTRQAVSRPQRRTVSLLLAVALIFAALVAMPSKVHAAGKGYADVFRIYTFLGSTQNDEVIGIGILYGSPKNAPQDNYAAVVKIGLYGNDDLRTVGSVMSGSAFEKMIKGSYSTSFTDVDDLNTYLLELGAPDELLMLDEKPELITALEKAVAAKKNSLKVQDESFVFPDALAYANEISGSTFKMTFDSYTDGKLDVRMSVYPSQTTKGFCALASVYSPADEHPIVARLSKTYKNTFVPIDFFQEGSFGTTVQVVAKPNLKALNTDSLVFYSFDAFKNKYTTLDDVEYSIDAKGFLHFTTTHGGTVLITDRKLTKK